MTQKTTSLRAIANDILHNNKIAVIKTDTLYGIIANINSTAAINKIYILKKRQTSKPFIVLISNIKQLDEFKISKDYIKKTSLYWPGPVSIIMPVNCYKYSYLAKDSKIAFRLPKDAQLRKFIDLSGPVIAPSANPESLTPAKNIKQAKAYFKDQVDYYIDSGECINTSPSKLLDMTTGNFLR